MTPLSALAKAWREAGASTAWWASWAPLVLVLGLILVLGLLLDLVLVHLLIRVLVLVLVHRGLLFVLALGLVQVPQF